MYVKLTGYWEYCKLDHYVMLTGETALDNSVNTLTNYCRLCFWCEYVEKFPVTLS